MFNVMDREFSFIVVSILVFVELALDAPPGLDTP